MEHSFYRSSYSIIVSQFRIVADSPRFRKRLLDMLCTMMRYAQTTITFRAQQRTVHWSEDDRTDLRIVTLKENNDSTSTAAFTKSPRYVK